MGKLAVVSDLHIDINELVESDWLLMVQYLMQEEVTHIHIAGDIANTKKQALSFIDFMDKHIPTTFHWGNHEMPDLIESEIEKDTDTRFLNFHYYLLSNKVWLLGVNGWYDYSFAEPLKRDFARLKNLAWYDRLIHRPLGDLELMEQLGDQLRQTLNEVPEDVMVIMSTHFVPHKDFIHQFKEPYQKWNQMNAFLGSPIFSQIAEEFPQVKHIVFGHTHRRLDTRMITDITYHCRPLGYYYEWKSTFEWMKSQGVSSITSMTKVKRYLANHRQLYLKDKSNLLDKEWINAVTMIDYE